MPKSLPVVAAENLGYQGILLEGCPGCVLTARASVHAVHFLVLYQRNFVSLILDTSTATCQQVLYCLMDARGG